MVIYTAIYGEHDVLHEPTHDFPLDIELVCFTDQPLESERWEIRRDVSWHESAAAAKWFKMRPHVLFPDDDLTLYLDGNMQPRAACVELPDLYHDAELVTYQHPERPGWHLEAVACIQRGKVEPKSMMRQMDRYAAAKLDPCGGLYNGGFLLRRNTHAMTVFNELWWGECSRYTMRDQVSLPYVLRKMCGTIRHEVIDGSIYHSRYAQWWGHV